MKNMCYTCHGTVGQGGDRGSGPRIAYDVLAVGSLRAAGAPSARGDAALPDGARERPGPRRHLRVRRLDQEGPEGERHPAPEGVTMRTALASALTMVSGMASAQACRCPTVPARRWWKRAARPATSFRTSRARRTRARNGSTTSTRCATSARASRTARWKRCSSYLARNFPERPRPQAVIIPGETKITIREWIGADLGARPRRSAAHAGRHALVHGTIREPARPARSAHRRVQGVPAEVRELRPARPRRRSRGQHLVHRQHGGARGQARPAHRPGHRIPDAGQVGEGSAHAGLRCEGAPVVYGAGRQPGGSARSAHRRSEAREIAHGEIAARTAW